MNTFVYMRKRLLSVVFSIYCFFPLTFNALAGGFEQHYQSGRSAAMGGCGIGYTMEAASVYLNPGAISFLDYSSVTAGVSFYNVKGSYLSPFGGNTDREQEYIAPIHVYGVLKFPDSKLTAGISVNQPYGFSTKWPANWTGRYLVTESKMSTWFIQPTASYQFTEKFSAGLGPVIGFVHRTLTRNVNATGQNLQEVQQEFDGNASGFGANIGLYYEEEDKYAIGLTYRSAVKMKVSDGDVNYSRVPNSLTGEFPEGLKWDGDITTPSVISLGASFMPVRELLLIFQLDYTEWSAADEVTFEVADKPDAGYVSYWQFDNTLTFRFGARYEFSEKLMVRAGLAVDPSPVSENDMTPELPDASRFVGSAGITYNVNEKFSVDIGYVIEDAREREVVNDEINFDGTYKSTYNHFAFGVNINF